MGQWDFFERETLTVQRLTHRLGRGWGMVGRTVFCCHHQLAFGLLVISNDHIYLLFAIDQPFGYSAAGLKGGGSVIDAG